MEWFIFQFLPLSHHLFFAILFLNPFSPWVCVCGSLKELGMLGASTGTEVGGLYGGFSRSFFHPLTGAIGDVWKRRERENYKQKNAEEVERSSAETHQEWNVAKAQGERLYPIFLFARLWIKFIICLISFVIVFNLSVPGVWANVTDRMLGRLTVRWERMSFKWEKDIFLLLLYHSGANWEGVVADRRGKVHGNVENGRKITETPWAERDGRKRQPAPWS